jgi:hypothetical protein
VSEHVLSEKAPGGSPVVRRKTCFRMLKQHVRKKIIFLKPGLIADASAARVTPSRVFPKALRLSHDRQA